MRKAVTFSALFHALVFALAYFGLPGLKPAPVVTETPIMIELVEVTDETRAPPPKREPEKKAPAKPKEEAKAEPKPEPPKPPEPPKRADAPPPPPAPPTPEPEPKAVAVPPPPQPKAQAKKKPEPEDKPKPEAKPQPSKVLAQVKPKRKPKAPDPFASVLKTVEKLKSQPKTEAPKQKTDAKPKDDFEAQIAKALVSRSASADVPDKLTISEIDLVRQQIMRCWNVQGGYKDIENLSVEISVAMNPDGTVRQAKVEKANQFANDPFKRAFAEAAYRAVTNPMCQPFKLPPEKYSHWKTMTLNFDPRDML